MTALIETMFIARVIYKINNTNKLTRLIEGCRLITNHTRFNHTFLIVLLFFDVIRNILS